jgi:hypothetical protein
MSSDARDDDGFDTEFDEAQEAMPASASDSPAEPSLVPLPQPPRFVPASLRLGLWFGGFSNQLGWFFFGFGMIFYWIFATQADYESIYFYFSDVETAQGVVTAAEKLNIKVNERSVYRVDYRVTVGGVERRGTSYTTDSNLGPGTKATIEYPTGNPDVSRIAGAGGAPMPIWILFVTIFPLIGLAFLTFGIRAGRKAARLLADGMPAVGTCVREDRTNVTINNRPVMKYVYEFAAADGNVYEATASTHVTETLAAREQQLLYNPTNPGDATLLAHLPYRPQFDELGQFQPVKLRRLFSTMVLPMVSTIGHGGYAIWRLASSL